MENQGQKPGAAPEAKQPDGAALGKTPEAKQPEGAAPKPPGPPEGAAPGKTPEGGVPKGELRVFIAEVDCIYEGRYVTAGTRVSAAVERIPHFRSA